jgi:hypothetical protein
MGSYQEKAKYLPMPQNRKGKVAQDDGSKTGEK